MSIVLRTALFTLTCWGVAAACSDPIKDSANQLKTAAQIDPHPAALPNMPLAAKPAEPEPASDEGSGVVATVEIKPWSAVATNDNKVTGVIQFAPSSNGMEVSGALKEVPTGPHGLYIHENGDCSKPGGHFTPTGDQHGDPGSAEHHLGDLGNVVADTSNHAVVSINVPGLALHGKNSILGRTLVVYADANHPNSEPSGSAGDAIGCGVITADGDAVVRPESKDEAAG